MQYRGFMHLHHTGHIAGYPYRIHRQYSELIMLMYPRYKLGLCSVQVWCVNYLKTGSLHPIKSVSSI